MKKWLLSHLEENGISEIISQGTGVLLSMAKNRFDLQKLKKIFIEAGQVVANYEEQPFNKEYYESGFYEKRYSEEAEKRRAAFSRVIMESFAEKMYEISGFEWEQQFDCLLKKLLQEYEITSSLQSRCGEHFKKAVFHRMRRDFPDIIGKSYLGTVSAGQSQLSEQVQKLSERLSGAEESGPEVLEERDSDTQREWQTVCCNPLGDHGCLDRAVRGGDDSDGDRSGESVRGGEDRGEAASDGDDAERRPKWNIRHHHVEGIWGDADSQREDIRKLTAVWKEERESYPGWYILPYQYFDRLELNTRERGLLQKHSLVSKAEMLDFAFEYAWRMETAMHLYSKWEQMNLYKIWDAYREEFAFMKSEEEPVRKANWFYIGCVLLREYREERDVKYWNLVLRKLRQYADFVADGKERLRMEEIRFSFYHLDLTKVKNLLDGWDIPEQYYEMRLQAAGMILELGMADECIRRLTNLREDIKHALQQDGIDRKQKLFLRSLQVSSLQLFSLTIQGRAWAQNRYEQEQENIDRILETIEKNKDYFDWQSVLDHTRRELLGWMSKKYMKNEAFAIDRETVEMIGGSYWCEEAYRLYRIMDRLALPLQFDHVTVMSSLETVWIKAIYEINIDLALFLTIRGANSDNIKKLVNRCFLSSLSPEETSRAIVYLKNALDGNLGEIPAHAARRSEGNLYHGICGQVPKLLMRFMVRCPEHLQTEVVMLLKKMLEIPEFDLDRQMDEFIVNIMECLSSRTKQTMLGTLMDCSILERNPDWGREEIGESLDLFYGYTAERMENPCLQDYGLETWQIDRLIDQAECSEYERKAVTVRLEVLYELNLLNDEQTERFSSILWQRLDETGLPELPEYYRWVMLKLPHPREIDVAARVKACFLNHASIGGKKKEEEGIQITMGRIRFFDELLELLNAVDRNFWTAQEAQVLFLKLKEYWDQEKERFLGRDDDFIEREFHMRFRKMILLCAELYYNIEGNCTDTTLEAIQEMMQEMKDSGLTVLQLDILFSSEETELRLAMDKCVDTLYSDDNERVVDALQTIGWYVGKNPSSQESEELVWELIRLARAGKQPGLVSVLNILQSLFYLDVYAFTEAQMTYLNKALNETENRYRYEKHSDSEISMKKAISVRKSCGGLAYQMYLHIDEDKRKNYDGVLHWQALCAGDEFCEVKLKQAWKNLRLVSS